jgi:hypothetical protein
MRYLSEEPTWVIITYLLGRDDIETMMELGRWRIATLTRKPKAKP